MGGMGWKLVYAYECPVCGALVRDTNDACNHECTQKELAKETEGRLELLSEIEALRKRFDLLPFYKRSQRREIKSKVLELNAKGTYGGSHSK